MPSGFGGLIGGEGQNHRRVPNQNHLERVVILWPVQTYPPLTITHWRPLGFIKPSFLGGWGRLTGHEWFGLEMLAKNVGEESVHLPEFANMTRVDVFPY